MVISKLFDPWNLHQIVLIAGLGSSLNMTHVVRSVSKYNEFVQKGDQRKTDPTYLYFMGLYSLKSFTMGFVIFATKMGQKGL